MGLSLISSFATKRILCKLHILISTGNFCFLGVLLLEEDCIFLRFLLVSSRFSICWYIVAYSSHLWSFVFLHCQFSFFILRFVDLSSLLALS